MRALLIVLAVSLLATSALLAEGLSFERLEQSSTWNDPEVSEQREELRIPGLTKSETVQLYRWLYRLDKDIDELSMAVHKDKIALKKRKEGTNVYSDVLVHDRSFTNEWRLKDYIQNTFKAHIVVLEPLLKKLHTVSEGFEIDGKKQPYTCLIDSVEKLTEDIGTDAGTPQWDKLERALKKLEGSKPYILMYAKNRCSVIKRTLKRQFPAFAAVEEQEAKLLEAPKAIQSPEERNAFTWMLRALADVKAIEKQAEVDSKYEYRLAENEVIIHDKSGYNEWFLKPFGQRAVNAFVCALDDHFENFDRQSGESYYEAAIDKVKKLTRSLKMDGGRANQKNQDKAFANLISRAKLAAEAMKAAIERRSTGKVTRLSDSGEASTAEQAITALAYYVGN